MVGSEVDSHRLLAHKHMENKISIVMSVRNGEQHLEKCIKSLLGQTLCDFELIITDDNSQDRTWELISDYSANFFRKIKPIRNETNIGLTKSLNKMLEIASGEFVARIDADDTSNPNRLEKQAMFLDSNKDIDMVVGCGRVIDENGKELYGICPARDFLNLKWSLIFRNNIRHSTVMWRKKINQIYNEDFYYCQDYEMWCRMIRNGHKIGILHECVSDICECADTITKKTGERQEEMACLVTKQQAEFYMQKEISNSQAKNLRLIYAQKSGLQAEQFQSASSKEISEATAIYLQAAECFFKKEKPDILEFAEEIGRDLNCLLLNSNKESILVAIYKWFDEEVGKNELRSLINKILN
ncbi:glycosyltransferase [bacterium]|nr:glycosyltransferase [bacterium]